MELIDLIESVDILEYVSQYTEFFEKNGEWWALSPLKDEKTPSFSVRKENQSFYDFASGIGGNVFTFIKYYHNCSSKDAVEILKKYANFDGSIEETIKKREKLEATKTCYKFARPKKVSKESKITSYPDNYMEKFEDNEEKLAVWENEGISKESMKEFQVKYDSFSNRIVYPIRDIEGNIVNIGGRTLDVQFKEKKIRKYTYFSGWGSMNIIYGLFENLKSVLEKKEIILFEGCKSVLLANTWGIKNCGAILTSHLNPCQLKILAKLGCRVVFALDRDVRIFDDHNIKKLKNYVNVEFLFDKDGLLDEKDAPVDKGKEVFEKLYEERLRFR